MGDDFIDHVGTRKNKTTKSIQREREKTKNKKQTQETEQQS